MIFSLLNCLFLPSLSLKHPCSTLTKRDFTFRHWWLELVPVLKISFFNPSCFRPGPNFTNILRAAFAPVGFCRTYWRTLKGVQHRSWVHFLVGRNGTFERSFVGKTQQCRRMSTDAFALCARRLVKLTLGGNFTDILHAVFCTCKPHYMRSFYQ